MTRTSQQECRGILEIRDLCKKAKGKCEKHGGRIRYREKDGKV